MKTVLITGCSSGIGLDAAHHMRGRGWRVIATCRRDEDLEARRAEGFDAIHLELGDEDSVARAAETALALARWTKETAQPAAEVAFDKTIKIKALNQASTYICRLRNNATTGKISEHAHGNAVDIASFTLSNGKTIAIQPRDEDGTMDGAFQRAVTASACLYFKTVLDPGSDAAHETHLHLDVIERRNDYRYCR